MNRTSNNARLFALGLVATAFGASYWHLQDYAVLVVAAWLYWCSGATAWQRAWLALVFVAGELAWPLTPLPMLVALAGWLVILALPQPSSASRLVASYA